MSYIHLLSLYNYSEVLDDVKSSWSGLLSDENVRKEIASFLGTASRGEMVVLYYSGHSIVSNWPPPLHSEFCGISPRDLREMLNSTLTEECFTLILDTCSAGFWTELSPRSNVLASSTKDQLSYGADTGIFTGGLIQAFMQAEDTDGDGWLSAKEAFEYAKNVTEDIVTWAKQTPTHYYDIIDGALPLLQRDANTAFPKWDVAVDSMFTTLPRVEPKSLVTIYVTVENQGEKPVNLSIYVYANSSLVVTERVVLLPQDTLIMILPWQTVGAYGMFNLSAMLGICPGELDTADNFCDGSTIKIIFKEDVNGNKHVDLNDALIVAAAYGSEPGDQSWNGDADITEDYYIGVDDVFSVVSNFGKAFP